MSTGPPLPVYTANPIAEPIAHTSNRPLPAVNSSMQTPNQLLPPTDTVIVLVHDEKRYIIPKPSSYNEAWKTARRFCVNEITEKFISLQTKDLDICDGQLAEITRVSWDHIHGVLKSIEIVDMHPASAEWRKEKRKVEEDRSIEKV